MELKQQLDQLHNRVHGIKAQITTEEATKNAFIMPFIQLLGYDIFNPTEVVPEYTADIGTKKGEKVDYAIMKENQPIIIIECKHWNENLDNHNSQLNRYFNVVKARFAILTNGIQYLFFTDLEKSNIMDSKPFLEINLDELKDQNIKELQKFQKEHFSIDNILSSASSLKYIQSIKKEFEKEIENPSTELTKLLVGKFFDGIITSKRLESFSEYTKIALKSSINDKINKRLQSALSKEEVVQGEIQNNVTELIDTEESKVITTEEELEGFQIIKAILRREIETSKIAYRDTQSYFGILYDDNNRKPICRLYLDGKQKRVEIFDENKESIKHDIESIDDLYQYQDEYLKVAMSYE
ncbi:hypothetical protein UJ101_02483 [Flavobacteriaceae bacterium UJ101]|nr:hypothetical protein UJ101_02483 [Flavobacteriaceae bacterium UJ101]